MKILIAEDDFISRKYLHTLLAKRGKFTIDLAADGREAVEAFSLAWKEGDPYDLLILDIMMPELDGQAALRQIRELEKGMGVLQKNEVKVIMVTALGDPKNVMDAFKLGGASGYLVKPIEPQAVFDELAKINIPLN